MTHALPPVCLLAAALACSATPAWSQAAACGGIAGQYLPGQSRPFGIGSSYTNVRSTAAMSRWLPQVQSIGIDVLRSPNANWSDLEPTPGVWNWTAFDAQVDDLVRRRVDFGILLFGNPAWNNAGMPASLPTNNLTAWSNYVRQVALRVRGKTRCLQVWNEPPNNTGPQQTATDYARIVAAAHRAVKSVDPQMRVGLSAKSVHVNYLEMVIRAGARNQFDYITLHPYEMLAGVLESTAIADDMYLSIVPAVRAMLATANPERQQVPVVFSEIGVSVDAGQAMQARGLVKAYVMGIAQGVSNIQWFEGRDGDSGPLGLIDASGRPRQAYNAMASLIDHLGRTPTYLGWTLLGREHVGYVFDGTRGKTAVVWTTGAGRTDTLAFASPVQVLDLETGRLTASYTVTIDERPVLIVGLPPAHWPASGSHATLPRRPGLDFSAAREVFIDYATGQTNGGLQTRAESAVAAAVAAYGGASRAGDIPGGAVFVLHPSFLGHATVPLDITAVVRRRSRGALAGFNLKYEARTLTGFRRAGTWYTVPDNGRWNTRTWRIHDPEFVGQWGYHFALDSDGVYTDYEIQSIRVRKVESTATR